jgi:alkanesulfonate monooxygenase SsuD/methylene tetrahydromethanopterin reductase-like flavin-dependent oxidoreductase (luciferase family)
MDRAARLTDGVVPYDFLNVDEKFPRLYEDTIEPAMRQHGRTLDDFKLILCTSMWASEDPERDYQEFFLPALRYQFGKYAEWAGVWGEPGYATLETLEDRANLLVDTPENIAKRLLEIRERAPFHEVMFWYRFRGIPHEKAMEHLELVARRVVPLLSASGAESSGP